MDASARREVLLVASVTAVSTVPLTYAFAHREIVHLWEAEPRNLVTLAIVGLLLSFAGAILAHGLPLPRLRASSRLAQLIHGAIVGVLFGLVAGGVGWLAADASVWALLLWFFFGAVLMGGARGVLQRKVQRDG